MVEQKGENSGISGEDYRQMECSKSGKGDVEQEWQPFKSALVGCTEKVYGMRGAGGRLKKGSEWWCGDVRVTVAEKRRDYEV